MEKLLEMAGAASDQAEAYRLERVSNAVRFTDGKLKDIEATRLSGTSLRLLERGCCGFAYTRNLADPSALVENARLSLAGGTEAGYTFPKTGELPRLDTFDPGAESTTTTEIVDEFTRVSEFLRERTDAEISLWGGMTVDACGTCATSASDARDPLRSVNNVTRERFLFCTVKKFRACS